MSKRRPASELDALPPKLRAQIDRIVAERVDERVDEYVQGKRFREEVREIVKHSRLRESLLIGPESRLKIHRSAVIKNIMFNTSSGRIVIHKGALIAHFACLLTGTHDVEEIGEARRSGVPSSGRDIVIGEGAWIATGATVIGPCTIGEHAVVAAGAVVTRDVEPYTMVAGNPAEPIGTVGKDGDRPQRSGGRKRSGGSGKQGRAKADVERSG